MCCPEHRRQHEFRQGPPRVTSRFEIAPAIERKRQVERARLEQQAIDQQRQMAERWRLEDKGLEALRLEKKLELERLAT